MRIEDVFRVLHDGIENTYGERLRNYLTCNPAPNWVIASDYVIGDKNRYRDTFCYTIFPVVGDLTATQVELREKIPRDLKATSLITNSIVECLRSHQRFSFCFVVDPRRGFFSDVNDVRSSIDATLARIYLSNFIFSNIPESARGWPLARREAPTPATGNAFNAL
jgi:hypothetical protein